MTEANRGEGIVVAMHFANIGEYVERSWISQYTDALQSQDYVRAAQCVVINPLNLGHFLSQVRLEDDFAVLARKDSPALAQLLPRARELLRASLNAVYPIDNKVRSLKPVNLSELMGFRDVVLDYYRYAENIITPHLRYSYIQERLQEIGPEVEGEDDLIKDMRKRMMEAQERLNKDTGRI